MTEREKFEAVFPGAGVFKYERGGEQTYRKPYDELWEGWQAAIASRDAEVEALRADVERKRKALSAMLTHMGMDEDEWNRPTFDQARAAIDQEQGS